MIGHSKVKWHFQPIRSCYTMPSITTSDSHLFSLAVDFTKSINILTITSTPLISIKHELHLKLPNYPYPNNSLFSQHFHNRQSILVLISLSTDRTLNVRSADWSLPALTPIGSPKVVGRVSAAPRAGVCTVGTGNECTRQTNG